MIQLYERGKEALKSPSKLPHTIAIKSGVELNLTYMTQKPVFPPSSIPEAEQ